MRNIDPSFSNMTSISCETLHYGTSDHWPIVLMCENTFFDMKSTFSHTNWRAFEITLVLLQTFWIEERKRTTADESYCQYVRFIAAVKTE